MLLFGSYETPFLDSFQFFCIWLRTNFFGKFKGETYGREGLVPPFIEGSLL